MNNKKYLIPNSITLVSLIFAVIAIIVAIEGRILQSQEKFAIACWCIGFSAICDFLDGAVARLTKTTSLFGMQFDSLCDLVAFGVGPAVVIYCHSLHELKTKGIIIAAVYVSCGAVRLARYNVMALNNSCSQTSLGLPIPLAAAQIVSMILYSQSQNWPISVQRNIFAAFTIYLSIAMVSNFEYVSNKMVPKTKESKMIILGVCALILIGMIINFQATAFFSILIYCLSGPIISLGKVVVQQEQQQYMKQMK